MSEYLTRTLKNQECQESHECGVYVNKIVLPQTHHFKGVLTSCTTCELILLLCGVTRHLLSFGYLCLCVSGGVDTAAGGEEEDQEGLQAVPAPFSDKPRPQQPGPEQHIL